MGPFAAGTGCAFAGALSLAMAAPLGWSSEERAVRIVFTVGGEDPQAITDGGERAEHRVILPQCVERMSRDFSTGCNIEPNQQRPRLSSDCRALADGT